METQCSKEVWKKKLPNIDLNKNKNLRSEAHFMILKVAANK